MDERQVRVHIGFFSSDESWLCLVNEHTEEAKYRRMRSKDDIVVDVRFMTANAFYEHNSSTQVRLCSLPVIMNSIYIPLAWELDGKGVIDRLECYDTPGYSIEIRVCANGDAVYRVVNPDSKITMFTRETDTGQIDQHLKEWCLVDYGIPEMAKAIDEGFLKGVARRGESDDDFYRVKLSEFREFCTACRMDVLV